MSTVNVSMSDRQLRAGARVLTHLLNHDHPVVQRSVATALADLGKHEALGCVQRMYGALVTEPEPSRWSRLRSAVSAGVRRFIEGNIIADDPFGDHR